MSRENALNDLKTSGGITDVIEEEPEQLPRKNPYDVQEMLVKLQKERQMRYLNNLGNKYKRVEQAEAPKENKEKKLFTLSIIQKQGQNTLREDSRRSLRREQPIKKVSLLKEKQTPQPQKTK